MGNWEGMVFGEGCGFYGQNKRHWLLAPDSDKSTPSLLIDNNSLFPDPHGNTVVYLRDRSASERPHQRKTLSVLLKNKKSERNVFSA